MDQLSSLSSVTSVLRPSLARTEGQDGQGRSSLSDLLRMMGAESGVGPLSDAMPLVLRPVRAGTALYHEGSPSDAIYFVSLGCFKIYRTAEDGYEQVLSFAGRGEMLGFDSLYLRRHPTAAVALEDSRIFVLHTQDVMSVALRVPAFERVLHLALSRQLSQQAEIADLMAAVAAEVRLARFLMQVSARMQACGQSPRRLLLRMCRRDIASHLGVAHETVSRSFSALADMGLVTVNNREVEIRDMAGLKAFSCSTRGIPEVLHSRSRGRARTRMETVHDDLTPAVGKAAKVGLSAGVMRPALQAAV